MSFFRRHPWWKKSRGWKDLPRRWGRKARLSLEQLEDRVVPTGNLLVTTAGTYPQQLLQEFTAAGTLVRTVNIPAPPGTCPPR